MKVKRGELENSEGLLVLRILSRLYSTIRVMESSICKTEDLQCDTEKVTLSRTGTTSTVSREPYRWITDETHLPKFIFVQDSS